MKNSNFFSVLFLIAQSGFIVAANTPKNDVLDYDYDMLLDKKFAQEALEREQTKARLQTEDANLQKACQKEKVAQELTAKNAKEEAEEKAKKAAIVAVHQGPERETMLTQAIHAVQNAANQALKKTEDTVFKVLVAYKVDTYLQRQEAARNPKKAQKEAARFARKLDNSSNAFVS